MLPKRFIGDWSMGLQGTRVRLLMFVKRAMGRGDAMATEHKTTGMKK